MTETLTRRAEKDRRFYAARDQQVPLAVIREREAAPPPPAPIVTETQVPVTTPDAPVQTVETGRWEGRYFVMSLPVHHDRYR